MKTSNLNLYYVLTLSILSFLTFFPLHSLARETNLGDVTVRFCNDKTIAWWTKALELSTDTNKEEEICIYMNNAWSTPVKLGINFVDGSTTPDEEAKKACEPEGIKTNFGQYVKAEDTEFLIPAWDTLQTTVKLKFPSGVAGRINGCITYNILDQSLQGEWMFKVFSRRANFIDVLVSWDVIFDTKLVADTNKSLPNITNNKEVSLYDNTLSKTLSLKSVIINSGNLTSKSSVSWEVQWWFGLIKSPIGIRNIKTNAKKTSVYEYDLPKRSLIGGPITITLYTYHEAIFPKGFENALIKPSDSIIQLKTVMIPRWIYTIVWALVLAIFLNKKSNAKK